MSVVNSLTDQISRDEGLRIYPYLDCCGRAWNQCTCKVKGYLTIGYGHNLDAHGLPETLAAELRDQRIAECRAAVVARIPAAMTLDDVRRDVLVNMAYNMGIGGLLGFHEALQAITNGDWDKAAQAMLDSKWAHQVGIRAIRLAEQMKTGVLQ